MKTLNKKTGLFLLGFLLLIISLFLFWAVINVEYLLDKQVFLTIAFGVAVIGSVIIAKSVKK